MKEWDKSLMNRFPLTQTAEGGWFSPALLSWSGRMTLSRGCFSVHIPEPFSKGQIGSSGNDLRALEETKFPKEVLATIRADEHKQRITCQKGILLIAGKQWLQNTVCKNNSRYPTTGIGPRQTIKNWQVAFNPIRSVTEKLMTNEET